MRRHIGTARNECPFYPLLNLSTYLKEGESLKTQSNEEKLLKESS